MSRDDIIRMAREAGFVDASFCRWSAYTDDLERFVALAQQAEPQDAELSAALGWPGGISEPVLDRKTLLRQVADLRAALAAPQGEPACPHIRSSGPADRATHWCALAATPPAAPSVPAPVIAGALFDFLGWLTSRDEVTTLHSRADASVAVQVLEQWAALRGLSLDDARVRDWQLPAALSGEGEK